MSVSKIPTHALIGQYVPIIKVVMNVDVVLDGKVIPIGPEARTLQRNRDVK